MKPVCRKTVLSSLAALALGLLTGCTEGLPPGGGRAAELTEATLAQGPRGKVQVVAPPGYCIDRRSLKTGPRGGFALMARCDTLGGRELVNNRRLALITVTTAPMAEGQRAPSLNDLRQSTAPARVIETRTRGSVPLIRLTDAPGTAAALSGEQWRGAFALNGQLVALAIYVPASAPAPKGTAADLLAEVARRTRTASRAAAHSSASGSKATTPQPRPGSS